MEHVACTEIQKILTEKLSGNTKGRIASQFACLSHVTKLYQTPRIRKAMRP